MDCGEWGQKGMGEDIHEVARGNITQGFVGLGKAKNTGNLLEGFEQESGMNIPNERFFA